MVVEDDEELVSHDVTALFTSIPVAEAVAIITEKLEADDTLKERTNMSPKNVASLLEFCLTNTYFQFRDNIYQQKQGAAMGSPVIHGGICPHHSSNTTIILWTLCG